MRDRSLPEGGRGASPASRRKRVILSGGPASVHDADAPRAAGALRNAEVPVLGICYGEQAMAAQLGGKVAAATTANSAAPKSWLQSKRALRRCVGKGERYPVWMSHGDA